MSIEVHQFLNDASGNFTETAPRPPVPGEENELQSNGGASTRSSGSHKSHISGKSHSSGKSGGSHRTDLSHSPAATPRRSNLDKTSTSLSGSLKGLDEDAMVAPLGFEPEGSAASSPPFTENTTPAYLKWAENLNNLLEDSDGVKLFRQFLDQEACANVLDFWFACRGLKMVGPNDKAKIQHLIKLIYRKYIRDQLNLKPEIKKAIAEKMSRKEGVDQHIFDEAHAEVERTLRNDSYPLFIKCELYVQYVEAGGESPKTSHSSSGSNSVRPVTGQLPPLIEGEELKSEDIHFAKPQPPTLALTKSALAATSASRAQMSIRRPESCAGLYLQGGARNLNPYHVSYAPVSTQDTTEVQSLSSDQLTDDTMSLTDSSVDGVPAYGSKKWKKQQQSLMKRSMQKNIDTALNHPFVPRTDRAPKDRNIAETDPPKFAEMLIKRLEKVVEDQQRTDRLNEMFAEEEEQVVVNKSHISANTSAVHHSRPTPSSSSTSLPLAPVLWAAAQMEEKDRNESAQSILEEHCSRIWDNSAGQTPSRSPGRHSPGSKSPERFRRAPASATSLPGTLYPKSHHHKRKDREYTSTLSFDSGMGDERSGVFFDHYESRHKHVHHHHHHHHVSKDTKTKQQIEIEAQRNTIYYLSKDTVSGRTMFESHNTSGNREDVRAWQRDSKRSGGHPKRGSDSNSSVIDSGVSLPFDRPSALNVPNLQDPNNEKVLAWMLGNDISQGATTHSSGGENSDKGSSTRTRDHPSREHSGREHSSRKSLSSSTPPAQHRSSSSKRPAHNPNRSGSLDRSGIRSVVGGSDYSHQQSAPVLPSQPFVQDPSMPLLTPPNPTTQLEEAKRRLEAETPGRILKSKSFTGTSSKEKRSMAPPPGPMYNAPVTRSLPQKAPSIAEEKKSTKKQAASAPTTPSSSTSSTGEVTIVGYYFCGEPIPYRTTIPGRNVTLGQFKQLITKRGTYRYFFKKDSNEFGSGVVLEEVSDDLQVLPLWEGKVVGTVDKVE